MTKTYLPYNSAGDLRPANTVILAHADYTRGITHAGALRPDLGFVMTFRGGKLSSEPKNGLERRSNRSSRFSTICAKNPVLKLNIDKVTVIIRRKSPLVAPPHVNLVFD
jgi:hypothetical protein